MFDGRDRRSGNLVPKLLYYPLAPHVGAVVAHNLGNAYFVPRNAARGGLAQVWPRNTREPSAFFEQNFVINQAGYIGFAQEWRYVPGHMTHAVMHVCFSLYDSAAQFAGFQLQAGPDLATPQAINVDELELAQGRRITEGVLAPFEAAGGSYEYLLELELLGGPLETKATILFYASARAWLVDEAEAEQPTPLRIDSVSFWLESRG